MSTLGYSAWKTAFELSPIVLVNGFVEGFPGSVMPITAVTELINLPQGLLSGLGNISQDNFFAHFRPLPGATLIDQDIGRYPFANQAIAANAVIAQPLTVSMEMVCPARPNLGYFTKLAIMTALRQVLYYHNSQGGTYIVATPSFIYTNCIMKTMRDTSGGGTNQPQHTWQLDFEKPLITLDEAASALNGLMSRINQQTQLTTPSWSGAATAVGQPGTVVSPSLIPSAAGPASGTIATGGLGAP